MPTICHFEIPADDKDRCKKFYEDLFGWKFDFFEKWDYYGVTTGDPEKSVGGGMMNRQVENQQIVNYIDVPSIEEYAKKVTGLGGQIIMEKTPVEGMGWFACCLDTEKNVFALWENDDKAPAKEE